MGLDGDIFGMGFDELFFFESMAHHFSCIFGGSKTLPATNSSHRENRLVGRLVSFRFEMAYFQLLLPVRFFLIMEGFQAGSQVSCN